MLHDQFSGRPYGTEQCQLMPDSSERLCSAMANVKLGRSKHETDLIMEALLREYYATRCVRPSFD
jgi:hypothetical protein